MSSFFPHFKFNEQKFIVETNVTVLTNLADKGGAVGENKMDGGLEDRCDSMSNKVIIRH